MQITNSSILCCIGALYGLYILIRDLRVMRADVATKAKHAAPIIFGCLAWASAAYIFYLKGIDSVIDVPRVLMLVSWCWLAAQWHKKYD